MIARVAIVGAVLLLSAAAAFADATVASVQQALKDQGFYYGEVTGTKDADTTAAIRRYQIRNGLQVTGELNAETRKSLGIKSTGAATPAPARATPAPAPPPDTSDLRDDSPEPQEPLTPRGQMLRPPPDPEDPMEPGYAPEPRGYAADPGALFAGTPYEMAPPDVQRQVMAGAQALLARQGYYRSGIDGLFGPGTEFALRAYQSRAGLEPSGRPDMETLASLGLLPGQRTPGLDRSRRIWRRPAIMDPRGERIYIPN